jgi:putative transcriptional regulator
MIGHHPSGELLSAHAAGGLRPGAALVVACHLETCEACRREVSLLEGLGGLFLAKATPVALSDGALERTLRRLDMNGRSPARTLSLPEYLSRFDVPRPLRQHDIGPRRWLAPGIWFAPVDMTPGNEARTYLVWAAKNVTLPRHTHAEREFTAVLHGAYRDDLGNFAAGDFAEADDEIWHAPKVVPETDCLCLLSSDGPMKLAAFSARLVQTFAGMQY